MNPFDEGSEFTAPSRNGTARPTAAWARVCHAGLLALSAGSIAVLCLVGSSHTEALQLDLWTSRAVLAGLSFCVLLGLGVIARELRATAVRKVDPEPFLRRVLRDPAFHLSQACVALQFWIFLGTGLLALRLLIEAAPASLPR